MTESSTMPEAPALRRIMVVEDDLDLSDVLAAALPFAGLEPVKARNGWEALDLLATGIRPDLILLDLMMPIMDGREFRKRQRD